MDIILKKLLLSFIILSASIFANPFRDQQRVSPVDVNPYIAIEYYMTELRPMVHELLRENRKLSHDNLLPEQIEKLTAFCIIGHKLDNVAECVKHEVLCFSLSRLFRN